MSKILLKKVPKKRKRFSIGELSEKLGNIRRQIKALYLTLSTPKDKQKIIGQRGSLQELTRELDLLRGRERKALQRGRITIKIPKKVFAFSSAFILKGESRLSLFKKATILAKQKGIKIKNLASKGSTREFFKRQIRKLEKKPTISITDVYKIRGRPFILTEEEKIPDFQDKILVNKLVRRFSRRTGKSKNIRVLYFVDGQLERQRIYKVIKGSKFDRDIFRDWLESEEYDKEDDSLFEKDFGKVQKIVIQPGSTLSPRKIAQKFLDGLLQKSTKGKEGGINHCVFQPVIDWANTQLDQINPKKRTAQMYERIKKLANEYILKCKDGAEIENIQEFCNKAKVNFIINDLLSMMRKKNEYITIKCRGGARKTFNMINSRLNHLDMIVQNKKKEELTEDEMNQLYKNCLLHKKACIFKSNSDGSKFCWISTIDGFYMLKDKDRDLITKFNEETKLNQFAIAYKSPVSKIVRASYHQTGRKIFKRTNDCVRIDQKKAYANFKRCSYYQKFPSLLTEYRNVSLETNEIKPFLQTHLGFYKIKINHYNNKILAKLDVYTNTNSATQNSDGDICLPSPEILYLLDLGVDLTVEYGTWCVSPIDFDFPDYILDTKLYQKIIGEWGSLRTTNSVKIHGDKEWANQLNSLGYDITYHKQTCVGKISDCQGCFEGCDNCEDLTDNSINVPQHIEIHFDRNKDKIRHMNGFAAYICSYQRIQLLQQLEQVNPDNLLGVITDEIIISRKLATPIVLCDGFRIKKNKPYGCDSNENFLSYSKFVQSKISPQSGILINPPDPEAKVATIDHVNFQWYAHIGPGGSGKTYTVLSDKGYINLVYSCPSHKLRKSKLDEFASLKTEVLASLSSDKPVFYYPSVICIDEITCVSDRTYEKVCYKYPYSLIVVCGDISRDGYNYQLPCVLDETPFSLQENPLHIIEHTKNRRAKCDELKQLLSWYRENVRKLSTHDLIEYVQKKVKKSTQEQVKKIYKLDDYILGGHRNRMKMWVKKLKGKFKQRKYLVVKGNKSHDTGTIVISDTELKQKYLEERYSFTCHQIQGETIKSPNKIFIDIDDLFQIKQMLYVGLSRAENLDQILIISR